ncbi:PapB/FocB family fimbrial expression transcriptional regulator [Escherichia coli]|uniref:PapB/FocB family fimbrial expression transcriptional regulator n=1 Tax=Escherichia coli TaxID=562 RepID=UPI0037BFC00B
MTVTGKQTSDNWGDELSLPVYGSTNSTFLLGKVMKRPEPGSFTDEHFCLLIEISPIHSEKIIQGLRDYLVLGMPETEICNRRSIAEGYFRRALTRLTQVQCVVKLLVEYYLPKKEGDVRD